jgi:FkbM family methyltransferase
MDTIENFNEIEDNIEDNIEEYATTIPNFFFIQIGACDGKIYDDFHQLLSKMNWKGILIEPRKKYFKKLKETYSEKAFIFENIAISNKDGRQNIYNFKNQDIVASWQEGCATFNPENHNELSKVKKENLEIETVNCKTWKTLINNHKVNDIHLLIIDTEGYDFEIIKQISFDTLAPHIIFYEFIHLGENIHKSASHLIENGYYIFRYKHNFLCYKKQFFNLKT